MSRYITFTDERGVLNIIDTVPLDFGPPPKRIWPHEFEPKRYMNVVGDTCWCRATSDHPIHAIGTPVGTKPPSPPVP